MAPNCVNLSNPYHQCTQACSQSTNTKHTNKKKSSGYGRSVTDGQLGKKMNDQKRTYSGCPKASNPYHQCDDNCYKRLSDSGAPPPVKFERKKKAGSKPEPPVLDGVPASKVGAIYLSDASSPISHYSEKEKVEKENKKHVPSEPINGQTHIPTLKPVNHKDQPKDVEDKIANSHKVVPITPVDDTEEGITIISTGEIQVENESDEGEAESVTSEPRIRVGRYEIKQSFASIFHSILDKYGDIGASCHLESLAMRSYYIECVCFVVQELQSTTIMELSKSKLKELLAILKDVESAKLRVAWLHSVLDELAENIELIDEHQEVVTEKDNSGRQVQSLREELESELESLARKEQEVADIKTRIPEIRGRLSELELKASELNKNMLSIKSKVDNLHIKSLVDELL
ncbi:uncharacterized protein LOC109810202 [Cajanus cajan]|uniref:Uncharacterized protein n=1 Tax=Cajanus cajan TaxID=3821 RepID=A0A151SFF3_CAJCA|nr:uncharacterized protein LOC109810202 [Cajanus cajan]KYP53562.1 hypothetical protein KK1_024455 [Cajanus cajan]